MAASRNLGGRPRRPEALKRIYLRESLRNNWRTRKNSLGYTELTESEFAKAGFIACCALRHTEIFVYGTHSLYSFEPPCIIETSSATVQADCSTPIQTIFVYFVKERKCEFVHSKDWARSYGDALQFAIKYFHTFISCLAFSMSRLCLPKALAGKRSRVTTSLRYKINGHIKNVLE